MWPNPQETEEILNGKLHFLCSEILPSLNFYHIKIEEIVNLTCGSYQLIFTKIEFFFFLRNNFPVK